MPTEAQVLSHMLDRTRQYTKYYLVKMKDQDLHHRFSCEGKELNTAFWVAAHLVASENGLILRATGGPFEKFSWAKHFSIGSAGLPASECPPYEEVRATMDAVHQRAMAHLETLPDEALDGPNTTGLPLIGSTVRDVITHAIRHEGMHIGHLSWLCKLYGIRTM